MGWGKRHRFVSQMLVGCGLYIPECVGRGLLSGELRRAGCREKEEKKFRAVKGGEGVWGLHYGERSRTPEGGEGGGGVALRR